MNPYSSTQTTVLKSKRSLRSNDYMGQRYVYKAYQALGVKVPGKKTKLCKALKK